MPPHSLPPAQTECRFCDPDRLRGRVIYRDTEVVVIPALSADLKELPEHYIVFVPGSHGVSQFDLPDDWQVRLKRALRAVPEFVGPDPACWPSHAIYFNSDAVAGRTMEHIHYHVVLINATSAAAGMGYDALARAYEAAVSIR